MKDLIIIYLSITPAIWLIVLGLTNPVGKSEWIVSSAFTVTWPIWLMPFALHFYKIRRKQ